MMGAGSRVPFPAEGLGVETYIMGAEICCTQFSTFVLMAMLHAKDQELL